MAELTDRQLTGKIRSTRAVMIRSKAALSNAIERYRGRTTVQTVRTLADMAARYKLVCEELERLLAEFSRRGL